MLPQPSPSWLSTELSERQPLLQLGSPSDCQPCCHRNGSSKRNLGHDDLFPWLPWSTNWILN